MKIDNNNLEKEICKIIYNFPDYYISNFGNIKSFKNKKDIILNKQTSKLDICE